MVAARIELKRFRFPEAGARLDKDDLHVAVAQTGFDNRPIRTHPDPSLDGFLRAYQSVIYTQGPLLLAALIGGLVAALGLLRRRGRRRDARWAAAVFAVGGFLRLSVPSQNATVTGRSGIPPLVPLPPAGIIGADLGLDALLIRVRRGRIGKPLVSARS